MKAETTWRLPRASPSGLASPSPWRSMAPTCSETHCETCSIPGSAAPQRATAVDVQARCARADSKPALHQASTGADVPCRAGRHVVRIAVSPPAPSRRSRRRRFRRSLAQNFFQGRDTEANLQSNGTARTLEIKSETAVWYRWRGPPVHIK